MAMIVSLALPVSVHAGDETIVLFLPGSKWSLTIGAQGFVVEQKGAGPGGKGVYFLANQKSGGLSMSGYMEKAGARKTAKDARDNFWERGLKQAPFKMTGIKMSSLGEMATVDYMVPEHQGIALKQKNLYGYFAHEDCWGYVHVSKTNFRDGEEAMLTSLLQRARFDKREDTRKSETHYRVSDKHVLRLMVPGSWADEIEKSDSKTPPKISFRPDGSPASAVLITPLWSLEQDRRFNSPETIKSILEEGGKEFLPHAVEKGLSLVEIKGKNGRGYYYTLTDKKIHLEPGDYKYMTQGGLGLGDLLLMFTVLTNEKNSRIIPSALELLTGAETR
jgi:hypothetical protein